MTGNANTAHGRTPPGIEKPKRFRPTFHYELIACGLRGHELVGMDAEEIRPVDAALVRQRDGTRWYRCLRCDSWLPLPPPAEAEITREHLPALEQVHLPLRGKPLRDKVVLR